jgi:hypothetical protein
MNAKNIQQGAILAIVMIALSLILAWAGRADIVDRALPIRVAMVLSGLVLAFYGNTIPKMVLRSDRARSVRRFAGWAFVLSGLACAAVWALAPEAVALSVTFGTVGVAVVLVFGACLLSRSREPASQ